MVLGIADMGNGEDAPECMLKFERVFQEELVQINKRREQSKRNLAGEEPVGPSVTHELRGISLSGGGVRSAAFCLGALQALARRRKKPLHLGAFDYVSSVSGGGYAAAALAIGMTLEGKKAPNERGFPFGDTNNDEGETETLRHLRDNSRYLVSGGLPAILSFLLIYMRGLVLSAAALGPIIVFIGLFLAWFAGSETGLTCMFEGGSWYSLLNLAPCSKLSLASLLFTPFWLIVAGLFILYALAVSGGWNSPIEKRKHYASLCGMVFAVFILLPIGIALLLWLLKLYIPFKAAGGTSARLENLTALFGIGSLGLLPFIQKVVKFVAGSDTGTLSDGLKRLACNAALWFAALAVPLLTLYWTVKAAAIFLELPLKEIGIVVAVSMVFFMAIWFFADLNANGLHQVYRDRLSSAFIQIPSGGNDEFKLTQVDTLASPFLIMNAALNTPGSKFANQRGRNADFYTMSPLHVGGEAVGYAPVAKAEEIEGLNVGTAMAVSGAALAPNMGLAFTSKLAFSLAFLNFRLGRWVHHPAALAAMSRRPNWYQRLGYYPSVRELWREALQLSGRVVDEKQDTKTKNAAAKFVSLQPRHILLSDGGHIENLGAYELLRRRCRLIVAIDAEADPAISCKALTQLQRLARIDLGVTIDIDPRPIAASHRVAGAHFDSGLPGMPPDLKACHAVLGRINYPSLKRKQDRDDGHGENQPEQGFLLYIKASLTGDEYAPVRAYRANNKAFPHESTGDQFFSEEQFEVYRSLGDHIVRSVLTNKPEPFVPFWIKHEEAEKWRKELDDL